MKFYLLCALFVFTFCARSVIEVRVEAILADYGDCAILMEYEPEERIVHLVITGYLTSGTDAGCEDFAEMIWRIARIDKRIKTRVTGKFVPSRENPITYEGARSLVGLSKPPGQP